MVNNISDVDHLLSHFHSEVIYPNDTSRERNQRPVTNSHWYRGYVMEDPVVLAILGVIAVIIMATILRTIVNKILARRQNIPERSVSTCSYQLRDPPPPYPGKNPETVSDYLPSYESAVAMERRRQEAQEGESLTECASRVSVEFSISSDHFDVLRNDSSEQMSRESTSADRNRPGTVVSEWTISPHSSRTENTECAHVQNEELTSACMSQTNGTEISGL